MSIAAELDIPIPTHLANHRFVLSKMLPYSLRLMVGYLVRAVLLVRGALSRLLLPVWICLTYLSRMPKAPLGWLKIDRM
jgi:hypothetical protein